MSIENFIQKVRSTPNEIEFSELMDLIENHYLFTETVFTNGDLKNEVGENSGSCKLFSFAALNDLNAEETLACFGAYYREDVLENPEEDNHQNIRNFMQTGWTGIKFDGEALIPK